MMPMLQRVTCRLRGVCVSYAARQGPDGWPSFTCAYCDVHDAMTRDEEQLDNAGLGISAIAKELIRLVEQPYVDGPRRMEKQKR